MNNCLVVLTLHMQLIFKWIKKRYQIPHSLQKGMTEMHPAYVCDLERVRLCIVESKQKEKTQHPC